MKYNYNNIVNFLNEKRGYLKEGPERLQQKLARQGIKSSFSECKDALSYVRQQARQDYMFPEDGEGRVLIYDIETSYNIVTSWSIGKVYLNEKDIVHPKKIICISYKWLGEDEVYNLSWDENQDDKFLIEQFVEVLNEADLIVAHNGQKYDLPFIKTRAFIHGVPMLVNYKQFDTCQLARRKFRFANNKLDNINREAGLPPKLKTGKELWDKVILNNDKEALDQMIEYCDQDVVSLEALYNKMKYWDNPKFHKGVQDGGDKTTSPITGTKELEHVKTITTNRGTIKHIMKDLKTNRLFEMADTNFKKWKDNE